MAATVVIPVSVAALADRVSGPVAAAAAVVVGVLLLLILVVWLARKVVHKIIGIAVSVAAAAGTHAGMQTWIHHLISTATQLNVGGRTSSCWTSDGSASARKTTVGAG